MAPYSEELECSIKFGDLEESFLFCQIPLDSFEFLTRIQYRADNIPYDGIWAEHEIDHILIAQRDVTVVESTNEVKDHKYVTRTDLKELLGMSADI